MNFLTALVCEDKSKMERKPNIMMAFSGVEPNGETRQRICFPTQVHVSLDMHLFELVRVALPGNSHCIGRVTPVGRVSSLANSASPHTVIYPVVAPLCVTAGSWDGSTHLVSLEDVTLLKKYPIHSVRVKAYLNSPKALQSYKKRPHLFLKVIEQLISLYGVVSECMIRCKNHNIAQAFGINALKIFSVNVITKESNIPKNISVHSDSVAYRFCKDLAKPICIKNQCECGWKRCNSDTGSESFHISNGRLTLCGLEVLEQEAVLPLHNLTTESMKAMQKEALFLQKFLKNSNPYRKRLVLLLTGLSGCGKTSLVRCVASNSRVPFTSVDCRQLQYDTNYEIFSQIPAELPSERPCVVLLQRLDQLLHSAKKPQSLLYEVARCISLCEAKSAHLIITAVDRSALPADLVHMAAAQLAVGESTVAYRHAVMQSLLSRSELMDVLQPFPAASAQRHSKTEADESAMTVSKEVGLTTESPVSSNKACVDVPSAPTSVQSSSAPDPPASSSHSEDEISHLASEIAKITPGYVAQDLKDFLTLIETKLHKQGPGNEVSTEAVMRAASEEAKRMKPRVLLNSELLGDRPDVRALGGLQSLQLQLKDILDGAVDADQRFAQLGLSPTRGILLYGPPGCGKTQLICSLAASQGFTFFSVQPKHVLSPYVGESEQKLMTVFQTARKTRPAIIFFDEIDGIFGDRCEGGSVASKRLVTELLQALDGASSYRDGTDAMQGLIVCGATNNPHKLDAALLRPGRFDRLIYVPPPDRHQRLEILKTKCSKLTLEDPVVLAELAERTELFTGADLEGMVQEATTQAVLAGSFSAAGDVLVSASALRQICSKTKPKITPQLLRMYEEFQSRAAVP